MEENKKDVLPLEGEPLTAPQISEPVVNALAAALSKIETYVPTQYIDDGPPDIDADHLNHAEQAIMRVTNLANGAADAISALQSQVTQLNNNTDILENRINNTKRADNIEVFADGCEVGLTSFICHAETIGLPSSSYTSGTGLVLKRKQENVMVLLFATNTTTALKCKNEGGWRDWKEYTTKSDLKVIKKANVQFSNGFAEISFPGITYDSAVCINQEYRSSDGVQNLVFTAQVRPNELIIYARNAGDGSSYNGILNIMVIAIG